MDKVEEILTRGVEKIYPSKENLEKILREGKKLKLYTGIDPTGAHLHLGHMVLLRKLRQFQDLGHDVIVLIGDFTAKIGDPSDRLSVRNKLTKKQIEENAANYKNSISKILDLKKSNIRFLHNEEWTNKLKPEDMLALASHFTVAQLLERDMFQQRTKMGKEIYLHEFLYPLFQAYDSVTMDVDLEIGGNDQTFNMLAGRTLMRKLKNKEKLVLTTKLLTDPTGKKMGKTEGNMIMLEDTPTEIFAKVMAWPDEMIGLGFELLTYVPVEEIQEMKKQIKSGQNPMVLKKKLALEIVKQLSSQDEAEKAAQNFENTIQEKGIPSDIFEIKMSENINVGEALIKSGMISSKSELKRVVEQKGVSVDGKTISDADFRLKEGSVIKLGKRRFIKISTH